MVDLESQQSMHGTCNVWGRTNQFIFIKEGDELVWNDLIEALQEAADLGTDRLSHTPLRHKLNILTLQITTIIIMVV